MPLFLKPTLSITNDVFAFITIFVAVVNVITCAGNVKVKIKNSPAVVKVFRN